MVMPAELIYALNIAAVLGSGMIAGLFFVFSNTVMAALGKLRPANGIAAMQFINRDIQNPLFFAVFLGTGIICVALLISLIWSWHLPGAAFILAGSVTYLVGSILVTIIFNVPMNEALDKLTPESAEAEETWVGYLSKWTAWNHVRSVASVLGAVFFVLAIK